MGIKTNNPEIIINVSGKIIYMNELAMKEMKYKLGDYISDIIDIDKIRKLSMYSNRIDIVQTNHNDYPEAIFHNFGGAINKSIKITFKRKSEKTSVERKAESNILAAANSVIINNQRKSIKLSEMMTEIKELFSKKGHYVNTYLNADTIYHNETHLNALAICSIAMMNETSPTRPVDLYVSRDKNGIELKVLVRVDTRQEARGAQAIEQVFPWTSIRMLLIDSICEKNDIEYKFNLVEKTLKIVFKVKELSPEAFILQFAPERITMSEIFALLEPMHDMQAKEPEE